MAVSLPAVIEWLHALQRAYAQRRDYLTELDSAIGDADHGSNMDRGFTALAAELAAAPPSDIAAAFRLAATVLIKTVGGAAGPLYGTFFLRAAAACAGKTELAPSDVVAFFEAGVEGVRQRGKAEAGDKTMLDALLPAAAAMRASLADHAQLPAILAGAAQAAESGMRATIPLEARKGRASYLGPRSIGHQDPGATSSWLLIDAARAVWTRETDKS